MFVKTLLACAAVAVAEPGSTTAAPAWTDPPLLWQERYLWDALLTARDRAARTQSDPQMIPVLKAIAEQVGAQTANLQQIDVYVKSQHGNLRFAAASDDPAPSLETIGANFETLAKAADQVRANLFYLTARNRMAASQALPDNEMYEAALAILSQVQQLQHALNAVYLDASQARQLADAAGWAASKQFRYQSALLNASVVRTQDSVFAVYNSGYDLAMRCK